jgi:endonuclease I
VPNGVRYEREIDARVYDGREVADVRSGAPRIDPIPDRLPLCFPARRMNELLRPRPTRAALRCAVGFVAALFIACSGAATDPGVPVGGEPDAIGGGDTGAADGAPHEDGADDGDVPAVPDAPAPVDADEDAWPDADTGDAEEDATEDAVADAAETGDDATDDAGMDDADAADDATPTPDVEDATEDTDAAETDADGGTTEPVEPLRSFRVDTRLAAFEVRELTFEARRGELIVVSAASAEAAPADMELVLYGPESRDEVLRAWSTGGQTRLPEVGRFELQWDGMYRVEWINEGAAIDGVLVVACAGGSCVDPVVHDLDYDLVPDRIDNCIDVFNPLQQDSDGSGLGDACPPADPWGDVLRGAELAEAVRAEWLGTHRAMNYDRARDALFTRIDGDAGEVTCVYTRVRAAVFEATSRPDPALMNTEHSWPQSRGAGSGAAQADLHHLFPTEPGVNTRRGNLPFCEVGVVEWSMEWEEDGVADAARSGRDRRAEPVRCFEPPRSHKGDLARAMVYFWAVYGANLSSENAAWFDERQQAWFIEWNEAYPPSPEARRRNHRVRASQGSRNPLVDRPELLPRLLDRGDAGGL